MTQMRAKSLFITHRTMYRYRMYRDSGNLKTPYWYYNLRVVFISIDYFILFEIIGATTERLFGSTENERESERKKEKIS